MVCSTAAVTIGPSFPRHCCLNSLSSAASFIYSSLFLGFAGRRQGAGEAGAGCRKGVRKERKRFTQCPMLLLPLSNELVTKSSRENINKRTAKGRKEKESEDKKCREDKKKREKKFWQPF